jgi:hypothetical protein
VSGRKYSVAEIDEMRKYLEWMSNLGTGGKNVEDRLRTYMLNGTRPAELKKVHEEAFARWRESRRISELQMAELAKARGEQ